MGGPLGDFGPGLRELGITDAQREQIRGIMESHKAEFDAIGERGRTAHKGLADATEGATPGAVDEGLIRQRSAEVAAVMADGAVLRAKVHAEVFQVLTPEQQAKAKELRANMEKRMEERAQRRQERRGNRKGPA